VIKARLVMQSPFFKFPGGILAQKGTALVADFYLESPFFGRMSARVWSGNLSSKM
jgi:hypothetical protein